MPGAPAHFISGEAPLFRMPILGFFVRALDCLPVYRHQDEGEDVSKNREMFVAAQGAARARWNQSAFARREFHTTSRGCVRSRPEPRELRWVRYRRCDAGSTRSSHLIQPKSHPLTQVVLTRPCADLKIVPARSLLHIKNKIPERRAALFRQTD